MRAATIGLSLAVWLLAPVAGAATIVLESPEPGGILSAGFALDREAAVEIDAVVVLDPDRRGWLERLFVREDRQDEAPYLTHAVLLDADSRRTLWRTRSGDGRRSSGDLITSTAELTLPPGRYELHLVALAPGRRGGGIFLSDEADTRDARVALDVRADGLSRFDPDGRPAGALLMLGPVPSGRLARAGFALAEATALRVRSVYEAPGDDLADYGWIADAATGEIVWLPRASAATAAGGARKNREVNERVDLPAGRYVLAFGTDDSHAVDGFNAPPPDDPLGWGIALLPGPGFDAAAWSTFDPEPAGEAPVGWTRVGDGASLRQGFRLARDGSVRIDASGEWAGRRSFVDGAWLIDAATDREVWRMTGRNTVPAGGSSKNRRFTGEVRLDAGVYELHYVSDDSHAYDDWNGALPFEPEAWGVTVRPGPGLVAADVEPLDDAAVAEAAGYLARLVSVGSDRRERVRFRLERATRVRIVALGEGSGGTMYDRGGIDDATGRPVWRMEFDDTEPAGGAAKNRRVETRIELQPGDYEAWFVTDDSHAAGDWNADPPDEPWRWGISVRRVE